MNKLEVALFSLVTFSLVFVLAWSAPSDPNTSLTTFQTFLFCVLLLIPPAVLAYSGFIKEKRCSRPPSEKHK